MMNLLHEISLKPYNSFGVDVQARSLLAFGSVEEMQEGLAIAARYKQQMILGGGSNVLFTGYYDGIVLKNNISGMAMAGEDDEHVYLRAGAGESWHQLVLYALEKNLGGIENLALIPGSVGASPMQNIGAYGQEIKNVLHSLEAYHIEDKAFVTFTAADCAFGYRESVFKNRYKNQFVILSVTLALQKQHRINTSYGAIEAELSALDVVQPTIQDVAKAVIRIRQSKLPDPSLTGNAGSFFKNPTVPLEKFNDLKMEFPGLVAYPSGNGQMKLAAGWLIESCGWKGYREGDAGCHPKQALVLVNYGKASGEEILNLSQQIIDSVKNKFDIQLSPEVNIY